MPEELHPIQDSAFSVGNGNDFRAMHPDALAESKEPEKTAFQIEQERLAKDALKEALKDAQKDADEFFGRKASDTPKTAFEVEVRRPAADAANPPVSDVPESAPPLPQSEEKASDHEQQEQPATAEKGSRLEVRLPPLPSKSS